MMRWPSYSAVAAAVNRTPLLFLLLLLLHAPHLTRSSSAPTHASSASAAEQSSSDQLPSPASLTWRSTAEARNRPAPQLLVISFDGFRYDYFDLFPMRSLRSFARSGVHARRGMKGVFSTVTFASHYTLATGLYEESHGIIGNKFFDPETNSSFHRLSHERHFYKGEPIWITAKRQGKRTAVYCWTGSEVDFGHDSPDIAPAFSNDVPLSQRLDTVLQNLEQGFDLVMLYYNQPDRAGHTYGALSNEVLRELEIIDKELERFFAIMRSTGLSDRVNLLITADHGMMNLTADPFIVIQVDDWELDRNADQIVVSDTVAHFYLKPGHEREQVVLDHLQRLIVRRGHFHVYAKRDIPERWHYKNSLRIGSVIAVADPGYYFIAHKVRSPPPLIPSD